MVDMTRLAAPEGKIWVCGACGKTAKDPCGDEGGWDESCFLNCYLIALTDLELNSNGCLVLLHEEARPISRVDVTEADLGLPQRKRGFACLSAEQRAEMARRGGVAAHARGTAHEWTSETAKAAGRKGGETSQALARARRAEESRVKSKVEAIALLDAAKEIKEISGSGGGGEMDEGTTKVLTGDP